MAWPLQKEMQGSLHVKNNRMREISQKVEEKSGKIANELVEAWSATLSGEEGGVLHA